MRNVDTRSNLRNMLRRCAAYTTIIGVTAPSVDESPSAHLSLSSFRSSARFRGMAVNLAQRSTRLIAMVLLSGGLALASGCRSSAKPTEPEGGFAAFRGALMARDADALWLTLSDDTHLLFDEVLTTLRATESMVDKLQPSDRDEARAAIGADLLDTIEEPRQLFQYIFSSENIPVETGFAVGLRLKHVEMDGEDRAVVKTASGQDIELLRDEDGFWRVRSPIHELFAEAFSVMESNRGNLETAINLFGAAANEDAEIARLLGISDNPKAAGADDAKPATTDADTEAPTATP